MSGVRAPDGPPNSSYPNPILYEKGFGYVFCLYEVFKEGILETGNKNEQRGFKVALVTKIKEYREKTGMKQTELAELVNVRRETIVHLENGRYNPSLKLAMDIAKVFGVTVEELFAFID